MLHNKLNMRVEFRDWELEHLAIGNIRTQPQRKKENGKK